MLVIHCWTAADFSPTERALNSPSRTTLVEASARVRYHGIQAWSSLSSHHFVLTHAYQLTRVPAPMRKKFLTTDTQTDRRKNTAKYKATCFVVQVCGVPTCFGSGCIPGSNVNVACDCQENVIYMSMPCARRPLQLSTATQSTRVGAGLL